MSYFLLSSKKNKRIIAIKQANMECFNFIQDNRDTIIRFIDYNAKPKILDRRTFIGIFYRFTNDSVKTFELAERLIAGSNNVKPFLKTLKLKEEYKEYRNLINKNIL